MSVPNSVAQTMPPGHEPATKALVFAFIFCAGIWLLIGTSYGLLAAVKLYWPDTLAYSVFSFGRIRPIHTSIVMFGWSSFALTGLALFVVTRTSRVTLVRPGAAKIGLVLWNVALTLGLITLSLGISRGPQEYREFIWPVALIYGLGLGCIATTIIGTVANRTMPEIYISNWYILGAFVFMAILFTIGYLPFYQQGLGNIIIQGYYMHNAVGLWFTPLVLGVSYYALPRMLAKPIYSYALGESFQSLNEPEMGKGSSDLSDDPPILLNYAFRVSVLAFLDCTSLVNLLRGGVCGHRRPVVKRVVNAQLFHGLSIDEHACVLRWESAQPTVHKSTVTGHESRSETSIPAASRVRFNSFQATRLPVPKMALKSWVLAAFICLAASLC